MMRVAFGLFAIMLLGAFSNDALACKVKAPDGVDQKTFYEESHAKIGKSCEKAGGVWRKDEADFRGCAKRYAKENKKPYQYGCYENHCDCGVGQCWENDGVISKCVDYREYKMKRNNQKTSNNQTQETLWVVPLKS